MATFRPYSPHFIYRWLSDVFAIFNPAGFLDILQWDMLHMAPCLTSDHHHNRLFIKTTGSTEVLYMARVHDQIYHWLDWPCTENIKKLLPNTKKTFQTWPFSHTVPKRSSDEMQVQIHMISEIRSHNDGRWESHLSHTSILILAKIPTLVNLEITLDCHLMWALPNI